jgi:2-(1,2-epoxy-1,2-dihydrophenyl)acetyl-CoA isomerase
MDQTQFVLTEDRGPVRRLVLNNPDSRNAIPHPGWKQIAAALDSFVESEQRVLVVQGSGADFCSGAELRAEELDGLDSPAEGRRRMREPGRVALSLYRLPKPTVAAVDGAAVGAGMNLAIGCDIVVATTRARFSEVFVRRGLTLDSGGTWLLPRMVGMARARDLALSGRIVDGREAFEMGLVGRVVEPEELASVVEELAGELAGGAPLAQRFIKAGLSRSFDMTFEQALAYEQQAQAVLLASEDAAEGIAAFLEGRTPEFGGT